MENITKDVFDERNKSVDVRLSIQQKEIDKLGDNQNKIETLTIQMGEILKFNEEKLNNHEARLTAVEKKPSVWWDKTIIAIITAVVSIVVNMFFR